MGAAAVGGLPEWSQVYTLGEELGTGQSAVAYRATAAGVLSAAPDPARAPPDRPGPSPDGRRVVAIKRFRSAGSLAFRQELKILSWVGAHPHILRLLEVFHGREDALVLEYCELGDMYEYFVRHGAGLPEGDAAELTRQLLLALSHLATCNVEHRDVKPENLLLYPPSPSDKCTVPLVKLADFGWANIVSWTDKPGKIPEEGVGSLWYAPPELNPPLPGVPTPRCDLKRPPLGSCDMWSVGVITYLLLVGHSPFNVCLRTRDPASREKQILKLAALGQINESSEGWLRLSREAQAFCLALMQPDPSSRLTVEQSLAHPFIRFACRTMPSPLPWGGEPGTPQPAVNPHSLGLQARLRAWGALDGLQRLLWLAVATAATEPEVARGTPVRIGDDLVPRLQAARGALLYVEELAVELAAVATPGWFASPASGWASVLRLAFRYLDVGGDGYLTADDLCHHVSGDGARQEVSEWFQTWKREADIDVLTWDEVCAALCESIVTREAGTGAMVGEDSEGSGAGAGDSSDEDDALPSRGFDLVAGCARYLEEVDEHASYFDNHPQPYVDDAALDDSHGPPL